jgi:O-glycosyl hydrolase
MVSRIYLALSFFFFLTISVFCQTIEVKWNDANQKITGFGASGRNSSAENFMKFSKEDQTNLCGLLFTVDKGNGLSMIRNEIYWHIEPSPGVWDWTKGSAQV